MAEAKATRRKKKLQANVNITREQIDWVRFAADQLEVRAGEFGAQRGYTGQHNCLTASDELRHIINEWTVA